MKMFGLSRLLLTWTLKQTQGRSLLSSSRRSVRRKHMSLETLEDRDVPTLLGQQLFPSDNPWNQNIANAPVAANSAAIIAHIGTSTRLTPNWFADNPANGSDPLYGMPINIVHGNTTAKVNVTIDNYPDESDIVGVPIPQNAVIEGDFQNGPNPNGGGYNAGQRGDSHLLIWDEDNNIAYELFGVTRPSDKTLFPNTDGVEVAHTDSLWHAAQETVWNMNTNTFRTLGATSADAAGLSILAGLARPDEGLPVSEGGQGVINHALRVTLPSGEINPQYVYPASHIVSVSQGADNVPLGGRLRLANTPAIDALIANMPPESQIIAHAMQQYGLIVADIGSAMYVSGASASVDANNKINLTWNLNDIFASNGLEALNAGDFQVLNLTPVVTGLSASSGAPGSTITITGQNFSGAAGHISVFFGNTAASNVTVVSDTQITAVVPNGSGTVDVTVQSGVNETDNISSNPNANVNGPIFGYGTSATSAADKFTFGSGSGTVTLQSVSLTPANPMVTVGDSLSFTATGTFSDASTEALTTGVSWTSSNTAVATVDSNGNVTTLKPGSTTITATDDGVSGSTTLTVSPAAMPAVTKLDPSSGPATGGNTVTITGSNFTNVTSVDFGSTAVGFTVVSPTTITATAPAGTTGQAVDVTVSTTVGTSATTAADKYTFTGVAKPTITTQPSNVTVTEGQPARFTVVATGTGLTYQWQKHIGASWVKVSTSNTVNFTGGRSATLRITSATTSDAGKYRVVVSNAAGSVISTGAMLTVTAKLAAPKVTQNPSNDTANVGTTAAFTAAASGSPTPKVQWQVSASGGAFTNIAGATSTTYSFTIAASENGNQYRAVFTNSAGTATTSAATLTTASGMVVGAGQQVVVTAGETVSGLTVMPGGDLIVEAGGTDKGSFIAGGDETVEAGGQAIGTTDTNTGTIDGDIEIFGTGTGLILDSGYINVDPGGVVNNTTINGDVMYVAGGGTANNTTINTGGSTTVIGGGVNNGTVLNGGTEWVRDGAVTNGTTVNNGSTEYVFAGGLSNNLTLNNGGNATMLGTVAGATINAGGTITVNDGGSATGAIVDNGTLAFALSGTNTFGGQLTGNGTLNMQGTGKLVVTSAVNNMAITLGSESSLELAAASNSSITVGYQSTLKLDDSQAFTGTLAATPGYLDVLDLGDVPFVSGVTTVQFSENAAQTQGVLTVSDKANGGPTVSFTLLGDFSGMFNVAADTQSPNPGTLVTGPF
jgi:autotransporter passenger strand-loop-strand repeat protein